MQHIKNIIKNCGAITIADFMQEAMFNPLDGYYRTKNPIGKNADFITAPEISQTFGEIIAIYFFDFILASPKKIALLEIGAGHGTLFYDVATTIKFLAKKFSCEEKIAAKLSFHIVEISESLTVIQQKKLQKFDGEFAWYQDLTAFLKNINEQEIYFFANELFDCFPIHQFVKTAQGWQEKMVSLQGDEFIFTLENFSAAKNKMIGDLVNAAYLRAQRGNPYSSQKKLDCFALLAKTDREEVIFEHNFLALNFMQQLCKALKTQGGIGIIIDYGYTKLQFKNTLQAIKSHQFSDVLKNIGNSDITALVNFAALKNCSENFGLKNSLITQAEFLLALGIKERQGALQTKQEKTAIDRLINEDQMGELFKCLLVWKE